MGSLRIPVVATTGVAPTSLAAFDAALLAAGIANFNLVRLSSVIPPGAVVGPDLDERPLGEWGDVLHAVWAFQSAEVLGQEAWAGIAWVQDPVDQRGLFVEHEGGSEAQVREELRASLDELCRGRGMDGLEQRSVVVGARCEGPPAAALVIAPYQVSGW
jgi:arginine decarboxylase